MNIEVFSVKGFSGNLLKNMLEEALQKNELFYPVSLINSVDQFIEAGLASVPALKIGDKIIQNSTENAMEEMIREAVDFLKGNEDHDILVPVDFSPASIHGLHYAKMMAGYLGLGINIVHVHYPVYDPVTSVSLDEHLMKQSEEQVEDLAAELRKVDEKNDNPVRISTNLEIGGIDVSLIDILENKKHDMMVMGTKGTDTGIRRLFGTVTSTVSRHATKPVIVVPPQAEIKFPGKIVIGFSEELIIDKTLETLLKFGAKNSVFFDFVHINDNEKEFKKLKDKLYENLMSSRDLLVGFNIRSMPLGQKHIDEVLSEYAESVKAGMIVLVAKHRNFIDNLTHQSVTKKALLHATLPLMVIHPVLNTVE
ncbi:MAG: universal stress protein [Saprospiraceae bacterium]|uniref:Universal stress protein n=1 Tax=Candidatus Opimibacter skivensis TaxID=2982028 RepID=A0A9D7XT17_9BACT|nr:universal stress protein [Candidatus Opimibacter skivensis]